MQFDEIMAIKGEVFRSTQNRETLRFVKDNKAYFIKKHFGVGWKELFKNLLQLKLPTFDANTEYKAIQRFNELQIPTMAIVDYGSKGWNPVTRQSFVMVEELANTTSLEDICLQQPNLLKQFAFKQHMLAQLAHITRTLHQNGINHRDYYLCHFLLQQNTLHVIDLHRVQIRKTVPKRWQIKDVAGLYFSALDAGLTERDIFRFLQQYFAMPLRDIFIKYSKFLQKVQKRAFKLYEKDHNAKLRGWHKFIICNRNYVTALKPILENPDKFIAEGELLTGEDVNTVVKVKNLVIKRYNCKGIKHFFTRMISPTRAITCWRNAYMLRRYGINTPKLIAIIENRWGLLRGCSYYITEYVPSCPAHKYFVQENIDKNMAKNIVNILLKFRKNHLRHGDAKANNFLIAANVVYVVDLDSIRNYSAIRYKGSNTFYKDKTRFLYSWRNDPKIQQLFIKLFKTRENE